MKNGRGGKVSNQELLRAVRNHYAPAVGSADLADQFGVTRQAIHKRLSQFETDGLVESDIVGKSRIWWLTTDGKKQIKD